MALRRRWRFYRTEAGKQPVKEFLTALTDSEAADVTAAMREVARLGLQASRHVRGDIYEVRATGDDRIFRILFAQEGKASTVLLALEGFIKKTQQTPPKTIQLAETRLADWRRRATTPPGRP